MLAGRLGLMTPPKVLLQDDFRQGLDLAGTWALVRVPPRLVADDGIVSTSNRGLCVQAAGTNPLTGEPAGTGLVALEPRYTFPTAFAGGPTLFGQGAELQVERFEIHSAAAG